MMVCPQTRQRGRWTRRAAGSQVDALPCLAPGVGPTETAGDADGSEILESGSLSSSHMRFGGSGSRGRMN